MNLKQRAEAREGAVRVSAKYADQELKGPLVVVVVVADGETSVWKAVIKTQRCEIQGMQLRM